MHKNQIWLTFLATIALVTLWFSGMTGCELYRYISTNSKTLPIEMEWKVEGKSSDHFFIIGSYKYMVKGTVFEGETAFDSKGYKNPAAAQKVIQEYAKKQWTVYHSPYQPNNSFLERIFPLKSIIYTAILWGVFLYFIWLGFYVGRFQT